MPPTPGHSLTATGTDLSPIQPGWYEACSDKCEFVIDTTRVPPNCFFEVDDFEADWEFRKPFDFIYGRCLGGSVRDFPRLFQRIYQNLNKGGWVEFVDFAAEIFADDDTLKQAPNLVEWERLLEEASIRFGKQLYTAPKLKQWMIDAGFKNVKEEIYKVCLYLCLEVMRD